VCVCVCVCVCVSPLVTHTCACLLQCKVTHVSILPHQILLGLSMQAVDKLRLLRMRGLIWNRRSICIWWRLIKSDLARSRSVRFATDLQRNVWIRIVAMRIQTEVLLQHRCYKKAWLFRDLSARPPPSSNPLRILCRWCNQGLCWLPPQVAHWGLGKTGRSRRRKWCRRFRRRLKLVPAGFDRRKDCHKQELPRPAASRPLPNCCTCIQRITLGASPCCRHALDLSA